MRSTCVWSPNSLGYSMLQAQTSSKLLLLLLIFQNEIKNGEFWCSLLGAPYSIHFSISLKCYPFFVEAPVHEGHIGLMKPGLECTCTENIFHHNAFPLFFIPFSTNRIWALYVHSFVAFRANFMNLTYVVRAFDRDLAAYEHSLISVLLKTTSNSRLDGVPLIILEIDFG